MVRCTNCFQSYDEKLAAGICPHCGHSASVVDSAAASDLPSSKQEDPRWLPIGTVLHQRYQIREVIGVGGFGITYKVWDEKNKVYKAVKEYFQQGVVNRIPGHTEIFVSAPKRREEFEYGKKRLLNEARIVAKFQSASIVRVDDYFEENGTAYMVMEYLESQTLEDYILTRKQVMTADMVIDIGVHICEALEEIHKAGVIHRDIAPDNIFVDDDGNVKIIDFGSARLSKEDIDDKMIVLKPGFAPPEQYERIDPSHDRQQAWTDVYALGASLYLCLTGTVPAESSDRKADFDSGTDRVRYPKELNPNIPDFLNNTIMTAMAINIHERFQNASELKAALLQERRVLPVEAMRKRKKMRRTAGIGTGFLIALLLVFVGTQWYRAKKMDSVLEPATISIWYAVDEGTQEKAAMENIARELLSSDRFSQITIELKAIPEQEYEAELEKACAAGNMPTIFECSGSGANYMREAVDLGDFVQDIPQESCYFLLENPALFDGTNQIPTGFNIPVIYINTSLISDNPEHLTISTMADFLSLCGGEMAYKPWTYKKSLEAAYESMLPGFVDSQKTMANDTAQDFLSGKTVAYFADTSDYYTVRTALPGRFAILPISAPCVICQYANYWSISRCEAAEQAAARSVLSYLLSNYAQDQYYLQGGVPGLPLEREALQAYGEVRRSFAVLLNEESIANYQLENP